ncbi:hypothetical protein RchiOBHm_Chr7g0243051 [Rosa chinensis]|uniref:Uncharacterized protein n=1 Tax=Rosa chinensis TaxID=74649 RepID=A0A2P6PIM9_ROSCH|nr:hypothetical protein RchiOBHm_Chr7g0243051 [Rosa chinensis]
MVLHPTSMKHHHRIGAFKVTLSINKIIDRLTNQYKIDLNSKYMGIFDEIKNVGAQLI